MSVSKTRKQHFVPRFYLKLFADKVDKFYVLDINKKIIPKPVNYKSQCHKRYFYGEDELWETKLSELESKWSFAIKKSINRDILTDDDFLSLKEFVLYQRQRTNAEYIRMQKERESIIREYAQSLYLKKGWNFGETAEEFCKKRAKEDVTSAENMELATQMVDYIQDLDVLIVRYNTDNHLITSDSPVVALNPFMKFQGFGYANIGITFLLPLSPYDLLVVYDGTLFTKHNNEVYIESFDSQEVTIVNKYEMINAEKLIFSSFQDELLISGDVLINREREINRNKTQRLGPEGQGLLISSAKGIDYYYELPYIKLPRDYQRIPYNCREAIPIKYDKGLEEKLSIKYKVFSSIKKASKELDVIPKTELKQGCRRIMNLANVYWTKHERRVGLMRLNEEKDYAKKNSK